MAVRPSSEEAEAQLIGQARAGDPEAVAELYRRHAPVIFRYLYARLQERAVAEDLTGAVFLRMLEGLPQYQDRGVPFQAWLFRIAHDRLVDHYRRHHQRQVETLSDHLADNGPDIEATAFQQLDHQRLQRLLRHLTEEQQLVVQLRFVEGYGLAYTATLLGKSVGAVKALQHRALDQLASRWEQTP